MYNLNSTGDFGKEELDRLEYIVSGNYVCINFTLIHNTRQTQENIKCV